MNRLQVSQVQLNLVQVNQDQIPLPTLDCILFVTEAREREEKLDGKTKRIRTLIQQKIHVKYKKN